MLDLSAHILNFHALSVCLVVAFLIHKYPRQTYEYENILLHSVFLQHAVYIFHKRIYCNIGGALF